ncbi:prolipoprotein diacylglyceryl transferase [Candidatus Protochlamydia phocaeensis]|uniref:prolipoprotein diacylglyceryl transferase n=1 Tax=Candidatus Protochlamydia phocaeensis TaxID=1414722 RepID=UPI000838374C|nr:prolipoprotein diacylglyceryl transferase [Candidatus Protochlamydia phocaeensis]
MQGWNWLAWLYWNPPREAFTVPFIDRPVVWYGILFVTGFILGYFIINPILARFLRQSKHISEIDVISWPLLLNHLCSSSSNTLIRRLMQQLPSQACRQLEQSDSAPADNTLKAAILQSINQVLQDEQIQREDLEQALPGALATAKQTSYFLADRLCWFIVTGTLVGARLGAVFFYDWPYFKEHPLEIIQVWRGGLASHGGVAGVMLSLYLYILYIRRWVPSLTFLKLLDFVAIPSALAACFIRLGNFMNQEILGTPTTLPWAVVFGHPADGSLPTPRHPVQIYEALVYLATFFLLYGLWKKKGDQLGTGFFVGSLFVLIFSSRFILEFWKSTQESIIQQSTLQMGQWLSIPFVIGGLALILWSRRKSAFCPHSSHS